MEFLVGTPIQKPRSGAPTGERLEERAGGRSMLPATRAHDEDVSSQVHTVELLDTTRCRMRPIKGGLNLA
jgi:hypothetical protein